MTDREFLLHVLSDGADHNLNEILQRSFRDRGCGLTVHSRAADLRRDGYDVRNWKDGERGAGSWYRLVSGCVETPVPCNRPGAGSGDLLSTGAGVSTEPVGLTPPAEASAAPLPAADTAPPSTVDGQLVLVGGSFSRQEAA